MAQDFWMTYISEIGPYLGTLKTGQVRELTKSAGGRPVYAVSYGDKPAITRTANYASAMAARRPEAFFGDTGGRTRNLVVLAGVHGMEVEGVMGAMNLISILETGKDLAGTPRPAIARCAEGMRVVICPLVNPDGRERVGRADLIGIPQEDQPFYCQGRYADGTKMSHPDCKRLHPMPLDCQYLGGYFNDAGVNIQADNDFSNLMAAETRAILNLVVDEAPEGVVNVHSHSTGPMVFYSGWGLPPAFEVRQAQVASLTHKALRDRGLRPLPLYRYKPNEGGFALDSMFHWATGCLPVTCEGPHGVASNPYTREQILEVQMTFHESFLEFLKEEGLRPPLL